MEKDLKKLVKKYLEANGIMTKFFAQYIGFEYTRTIKWLKGKDKLNSQQLRKVHEFLNGKHLVSVENIIKEE